MKSSFKQQRKKGKAVLIRKKGEVRADHVIPFDDNEMSLGLATDYSLSVMRPSFFTAA